MRHRIISISKAKSRLLELARNANELGEAYLLTKDGEPIGALVPMADYEALLETTDVLSSAATMRDLAEALEDERKSRLWKRNAKGQWVRARKPSKRAA